MIINERVCDDLVALAPGVIPTPEGPSAPGLALAPSPAPRPPEVVPGPVPLPVPVPRMKDDVVVVVVVPVDLKSGRSDVWIGGIQRILFIEMQVYI